MTVVWVAFTSFRQEEYLTAGLFFLVDAFWSLAFMFLTIASGVHIFHAVKQRYGETSRVMYGRLRQVRVVAIACIFSFLIRLGASVAFIVFYLKCVGETFFVDHFAALYVSFIVVVELFPIVVTNYMLRNSLHSLGFARARYPSYGGESDQDPNRASGKMEEPLR